MTVKIEWRLYCARIFENSVLLTQAYAMELVIIREHPYEVGLNVLIIEHYKETIEFDLSAQRTLCICSERWTTLLIASN